MTAQLSLVECAPPDHHLFKDLTGRRFKRLLVTGYAGRIGGANAYRARCDCGGEIVTRGYCLTTGGTKSCGCLLGDRNREIRTTHGMSLTQEWRIWAGMKNRCYNPKVHGFDRYGGAGVTVCDRWLAGDGERGGFECFINDLGRRPTPGHSLDRINPYGNYEPSNVRWATRSVQARNTKKARRISFDGATLDLYGWAERTGIHPDEIRKRLIRGWTVARALTQPMRRRA